MAGAMTLQNANLNVYFNKGDLKESFMRSAYLAALATGNHLYDISVLNVLTSNLINEPWRRSTGLGY